MKYSPTVALVGAEVHSNTDALEMDTRAEDVHQLYFH